jgi:HAE1 family hydrophobic/amphiphilic exporter-1
MMMLRSPNERSTPDKFYVRKIRDRVTREVPGIERIDYKTTDGGMSGSNEKPVTLKFLNSDMSKSADAAKKLQKELAKIPGLTDISNDADSLKPEMEVQIDRLRASQLGVKVSMVGAAVRNAFYGKTASVFRKGGDEYDFLVTLKKGDRNNVEQLKELEIKTVTGGTVKLKDVAEVKEGLTPLVINRLNRERIVTLSAALEDNTPIGKVSAKVKEAIEACDFSPDIVIEYGGNMKSESESTGDLVLMLLLGIILVYLVMAAQFESFLDPFIILFSIPFSISGVIVGLLITGHSLSVPAFLGMIILVGVVVNNAIVLLDYTNMKRKRDGLNVHDALIFSGKSRLRPILMTATTTISGMLPLALMQGEGHEAFQPMGVAVVFGLMVSTLITLILMPSIYGLIHGFLEGRAEKKATNKTIAV